MIILLIGYMVAGAISVAGPLFITYERRTRRGYKPTNLQLAIAWIGLSAVWPYLAYRYLRYGRCEK